MPFNVTGDNRNYNEGGFKGDFLFIGGLILAIIVVIGLITYACGGPDADSITPANNSINSNVQR